MLGLDIEEIIIGIDVGDQCKFDFIDFLVFMRQYTIAEEDELKLLFVKQCHQRAFEKIQKHRRDHPDQVSYSSIELKK